MDGDKDKEQFAKFLVNDVAINRSGFKNSDFEVIRLNEFLKIYTMNGGKYREIWKVSAFSSLISVMGKALFKEVSVWTKIL